MLSGRNVLNSIDQSLQSLRQQVSDADQQIQDAGDELISLQQQQTEQFNRLSRLRLDSMISGEVVDQLRLADQGVKDLLRKRDLKYEELAAQLAEKTKEQEAAEQQRVRLGEEFDVAAKKLDQREAYTQQRLQQIKSYQQQLADAQQAERIAEHAEEKQHQAYESRVEKGQPYEEDPLFTYLWKRAYGTSEYQAHSLARYLDRWAAELCDYHDARANYAMLLDIPLRLQEHAERVREVADQQFALLKEIEEVAAQEDGLPGFRVELDRVDANLSHADQQIEKLGVQLEGFYRQKADFAAGEDELYKQAVDMLSQVLEKENLKVLYYQAKATLGVEDDSLVEALSDNKQRIGGLQASLSAYGRRHETQLQRLAELEQLRGRFKHERYDDIHSSFTNKALLLMVLNQFVQGVSNSGDLWDTILREQRYRRIEADPGFGTGGFRRRNGTWRSPFPRSTGSGHSRSGGSGTRGGGFRTGGGF